MCILLLVNNSETLSYTHSHREIVLLSKQGIFIHVHLFNLNLLKDNHFTTMRHKLKHLVFVYFFATPLCKCARACTPIGGRERGDSVENFVCCFH